MRRENRHWIAREQLSPTPTTWGDERWTSDVRVHTHRFSPELGPATLARYDEVSPLIQTLPATESACDAQ